MAALLLIVAYVLLALLGLVALLVILPFHVRASGQVADDTVAGQLRVAWAWGLASVRVESETGAALYACGVRVWRFSSENDDATDSGESKKKQKEKQKESAPLHARIRWARDHRDYLMKVGVRLLAALRIRLCVHGELGLDDPADTFLMFELLSQLERIPVVELDLERNYIDDTLDVDVELRGRVWLLGFAGLVLSVFVRPQTWRVLRARP